MFGIDAFYIGEKIVFAFYKKDDTLQENGIWVATKREHHKSLLNEVKGLGYIKGYGPKTWLILHETSDTFEEEANYIADLIKANSPRIGNIPKSKGRAKIK